MLNEFSRVGHYNAERNEDNYFHLAFPFFVFLFLKYYSQIFRLLTLSVILQKLLVLALKISVNNKHDLDRLRFKKGLSMITSINFNFKNLGQIIS